ncbi:hypothetical protein JRO89_XS01G0029200 [Xanthoceras sorbifolium]|uniref:Uncharacterized protein n=1 Tax=Xanthoceras sorbifolium TaxID=99658 RepID=A0ABQ8II77_9ROSI|nr:hypothetical protein JRO89_XS01G0029200 [Xanthoceras sorbifolium]
MQGRQEEVERAELQKVRVEMAAMKRHAAMYHPLYANITGGDARLELLAATRSLIVAIVTTRLRCHRVFYSEYCKTQGGDINPKGHRVFYSGCQVCLPSVASEFLRQSKAVRLFTVSRTFIFNDLLESELSRAFGGIERLNMFFPFDPCLLKKCDRFTFTSFELELDILSSLENVLPVCLVLLITIPNL